MAESEKFKLPPSIQSVASRFKIHTFTTDVSDVVYIFHILQMKDSIFIYIGESQKAQFSELAMAFPTEDAVSTQIFGPSSTCESKELSQQFTKRLKKQVFLSYNVPQNNSLRPLLVKRLVDEIKQNPNAF